jgi:hypothetical protein
VCFAIYLFFYVCVVCFAICLFVALLSSIMLPAVWHESLALLPLGRQGMTARDVSVSRQNTQSTTE